LLCFSSQFLSVINHKAEGDEKQPSLIIFLFCWSADDVPDCCSNELSCFINNIESYFIKLKSITQRSRNKLQKAFYKYSNLNESNFRLLYFISIYIFLLLLFGECVHFPLAYLLARLLIEAFIQNEIRLRGNVELLLM
jgi:hypothetical protein